jgi:hypothetical protein
LVALGARRGVNIAYQVWPQVGERRRRVVHIGGRLGLVWPVGDRRTVGLWCTAAAGTLAMWVDGEWSVSSMGAEPLGVC